MTKETRYRYEQRIRDLDRDVSRLSDYKMVARTLHDHLTDCATTGNHPDTGWMLRQFKQVMK